jgi:hypothetical protein
MFLERRFELIFSHGDVQNEYRKGEGSFYLSKFKYRKGKKRP